MVSTAGGRQFALGQILAVTGPLSSPSTTLGSNTMYFPSPSALTPTLAPTIPSSWMPIS
jgi:hypothetical protein